MPVHPREERSEHAAGIESGVKAVIAALRGGDSPDLAQHAARAEVNPHAFDALLLERLFELYLEEAERGTHAWIEELGPRAGACSKALRERIALYRELGDLGMVLAHAPDSRLAGAMLGPYRILAPIGEGGLSRVVLAEHPALSRKVAIKVLREGALHGLDAERWMRTEGRSLARLAHESVVRVYEVARLDGHPCIVMEYVEGATLAETIGALRELRDGGASGGGDSASVVAARALTSLSARCRLVARLARALEYCHARGVVHRDVKPANVIVGESVHPRLVDFGLAHLETEQESLGLTQRLVGTAGYVSPEQIENGRAGADPLSDQFALGIVLYELLTLDHPFARDSRADTLDAISRAQPQPPRKLVAQISSELELVVMHALEREPGKRFPSMGALAADLEAIVEHRPIALRRPSLWRRLALWTIRHRTPVLAAGGSSLLVLAGAAGFTLRAEKAEQRDFEDRTRALVASLPTTEFTSVLEQAGKQLSHLVREGEQLDRRTLFGSGTARASLHDAIGAFSRRISELSRARLDLVESMVLTDEDRLHVLAEVHEDFGEVLQLEAELSPDGPENRELRGYGTIGTSQLPEGVEVELFRYLPASYRSADELERVEFKDRPDPGLYRLRLHGGPLPGNLERDFEVSWEMPGREIVLAEREHPGDYAGILQRAREDVIEVRASAADRYPTRLLDPLERHRMTHEFEWESVESTDGRAGRMMERPVTWEEVGAVLGREYMEVQMGTELGIRRMDGLPPPRPSDPAILPPVSAQDFAAAVGGRLPCLGELQAYFSMQGADPELHPYLLGEHTSSMGAVSHDRASYRYSGLHQTDAQKCVFQQEAMRLGARRGFRVLFPP